MKWSSTLHSSSSVERAVREASREIAGRLGSDLADFGLLFVSAAYRPDLIDLWPVLKRELRVKHLLGCTAGGVIGGGHEVEGEPAVSLTAALLPEVTITPFQISQENLPDPDRGPRAWRDLVKMAAEEKASPAATPPHFLLLSDPFSMDADALVAGLDFAFPHSIKVGGLASGGAGPNENLLLSDEKILSRGAVGVALSGNIRIEAVVAQGCRPIGEPLSITESDGNVLISVDDRAPLAYLQDLYGKLKARDQELLQTSLFLGIVMDPFKANPRKGDFLIRNIVGLDQNKGFLAIGAYLRPGQTVQFHLRDAETSHDDLRELLTEAVAHKSSAAGAALFSCLGRGKRLYGKPDHDSGLIKSLVGDIPIGGFFCNGEIGPVGRKTYLHGYTSSIAVFTPAKDPAAEERP